MRLELGSIEREVLLSPGQGVLYIFSPVCQGSFNYSFLDRYSCCNILRPFSVSVLRFNRRDPIRGNIKVCLVGSEFGWLGLTAIYGPTSTEAALRTACGRGEQLANAICKAGPTGARG